MLVQILSIPVLFVPYLLDSGAEPGSCLEQQALDRLEEQRKATPNPTGDIGDIRGQGTDWPGKLEVCVRS